MDTNMTLKKLTDFYITSQKTGSKDVLWSQIYGNAWLVEHKDFAGLVAHKRQNGIGAAFGEPGAWIVTESTSGLLVGTGNTRDEAIKAAILICEDLGVDAFHKQIRDRITEEKISVSPNRLMGDDK